MTQFGRVFAFAILSLVAPAAGQDQPAAAPAVSALQQEAPKADTVPATAAEVLAKMADTYRTCASYRDQGKVSIVFDTAQHKWTDDRPFKTAFVRPDKLRFEFTSKAGPGATGPDYLYVVWSDGKAVRSWWDLTSEQENHESIEISLAGPTGVSGGSAIMITPMLLDIPVGAKLSELHGATLAADEKVDGHNASRSTSSATGSGIVLA